VHSTFAFLQGERKADVAKEKYTLIVERMRGEMARFQEEKTRDLGLVMRDFAASQVRGHAVSIRGNLGKNSAVFGSLWPPEWPFSLEAFAGIEDKREVKLPKLRGWVMYLSPGLVYDEIKA
jgi:hypothetical protein